MSTLLDIAKTVLSTDINARPLTIRLVSPEGYVLPGNTRVKRSVRFRHALQSESEP